MSEKPAPNLNTGHDTEFGRHATWTELFYDLAYVATIAVITHEYSHHISFHSTLTFLAHLVPVWLLWLYGTYFAGWFDIDDLGHKFSILLQMIGIVGLAIFSHGTFFKMFRGFVISYIIVRISIIFNFLRAGYYYKDIKRTTNTYAYGNAIGLIAWFIAILFDSNLKFVFASIGLLLDYITPFIATKHARKLHIDIPHLLERFGLFTLIVLGESITAVVTGVVHAHVSALTVIMGILGMVIAFTIWRTYFETIEKLEDHFIEIYKKRKSQKIGKPSVLKFIRNYSIVFGHLVLAIGISTFAAGLMQIITSAHEHIHETTILLFSIGTALCFLSIAAMEVNAKNINRTRKMRYIRAITKIAFSIILILYGFFPFFNSSLHILIVTAILSILLLCINIMYDEKTKVVVH